jgi:hypothetical protein
MLTLVELREYHENKAVQLRSAAASATTPALRARLLAQAEEHERLIEDAESLCRELRELHHQPA